MAGDVLVRLLIPCACVMLTSFHFAEQGVDMFGKRVGFLKFKADVVDKETGQKVPHIPAFWLFCTLLIEGNQYENNYFLLCHFIP